MRIRTRVLITVFIAVLFLSLPFIFGLRLGLDLRGGLQLTLQVVTDDAVRAETDRTMGAMRSELQKRSITFQALTRTADDSFTIAGLNPAGVASLHEIL